MSLDWFDPEEMRRRVQPLTPGLPQLGGTNFGPMAQVEDYGNTTPWVMNHLAGAARGLASFLEPFQFPQDVMFALLAGWKDPDKSAVDYFRGDQSVWEAITAYAPGGAAPHRPASGEDILRLFGVEDARAAKWGGIAMDLVADPLIAGAWLKGAGLAARGMGFADTARDLMRLGERADYVMSAMPLYRAIPPAARKGFEDRAFALAQTAFNSKVFWNAAEDARTWGDMLLPRRQALKLQMMSGRADDAGREMAAFIARTEQTARSAGVTVQEQGVSKAKEALEALGGSLMTAEEGRGFIARGLRILGHRQKAAIAYDGMPTVLRQYIAKEGWDILDQRGIAAVMHQLDPNFRIPKEFADRSAELMRRFEQGVRGRAAKVGYSADDAWQRAQAFLQKATEADSALGFHLSGYEYVATKFQERANAYFLRQGFDPETAMKATVDTWADMMARAARGESAVGTRLRGASASRALATASDDAVSGAVRLLDNTGPTVKDILEGADTFSALNIDTFMSGIFHGHMRRAYGIMQDSGSFNRYYDAVRDGKVFLSNVLDESLSVIPAGFDKEFGLIREFLAATSPGARPGKASASLALGALGGQAARGRSTLVSRDSLFSHLMDNGVDAERARLAILEMVKQQNPHLARPGGVLDRLSDLRAKLADRVSTPAREGGTFGRGFFRAREDLSAQELELLGEFANPFISLSETAGKARSAVPFSTFMRETYDQALEAGFVRKAGDVGRYTDPVSGIRYVKIPDQDVGIWGAFAGKLVHPFLKKELLNAMKDRGGRVGTWARIRSLVTGGYLASPNVILANAAGGFFQAAGIGLTPDVILPSLARTLRPLIRYDEKGTAFDIIERLAKYWDLDDSTLIGQTLVRQFKKLEISEAGLAEKGLGGFFNALTDLMQDQLKRPGIGAARTRWLGLDGFQFVERWFKVAAFDAEYRRLLGAGAGSRGAKALAEEVARLTRQGVRDPNLRDLAAERLAAEAARLVVFDYCVDEQTEALTKRGWLRVDDIDPERDEVLTLNPETNVSEWQPMKELYVGAAKPREMHRLRSSRFDALVTGDHRWITEANGKREMRRLSEFRKHELIVASGGEFAAPETPTHTDEFVSLVGWYVTEGTNQARGDGVQIAQSLKHNPEYVVQLRGLATFFRARGATVSEYQRDVGWGVICSFYFGKGIGRLIREAAPNKRLAPEFLTSLTKPQLELLFTTLMAADGHVKDGTAIYTQADPGRLDDFQFLSALLGYRTGRRPAHQAGVEAVTAYRTKHVYYYDLKKAVEPYGGRVWCPVTPNGTWFARRGGMTYWTGNSELPGLFATARDAGILMFPGFNFFLAPRTVRAALQRPGVLAVSDRISDAFNNAFTDNDQEKYAVYANMPNWLREEQGSIVNRYEGPDGTMRYSAIPMNQLVPTETFAGNPWGESLMTLGLWRPLVEMLTAAVRGDGEAIWSGEYGQRVFDPGGSLGEKASQTGAFLLSNLMPGFVRKAGLDPSSMASLFDPTQTARGLVPRGLQEAFNLGPDMGELMYSFSEMRRRRPDRTFREEVLSATVRAPSPIATSGPLANIQGIYAQARQELSTLQAGDRRRLQAAVLSGNQEVAEQIRSRILKREQDFLMEWMPQIQAWTQGAR